jgi:copper chaperone CopZ
MKTILLYSILFSLIACTSNKQANKNTELKVVAQNVVSTDFHVNGMTCTGCENTITKAVESINGVKEVKASYIDSLATVTFDSTMANSALISQKINDLGYNVVSVTLRNKVN